MEKKTVYKRDYATEALVNALTQRLELLNSLRVTELQETFAYNPDGTKAYGKLEYPVGAVNHLNGVAKSLGIEGNISVDNMWELKREVKGTSHRKEPREFRSPELVKFEFVEYRHYQVSDKFLQDFNNLKQECIQKIMEKLESLRDKKEVQEHGREEWQAG